MRPPPLAATATAGPLLPGVPPPGPGRGPRGGPALPLPQCRPRLGLCLGRPLVPFDRPTRVPRPAVSGGAGKPLGLLPGLSRGDPRRGGGDAAKSARRRCSGGLRIRAHRNGGRVASCTRDVRRPGGRPGDAVVRLLPALVHPVLRVHRGALPHRGGGCPLRPAATVVDHRRAAGVPGRAYTQHGSRHCRLRRGGRAACCVAGATAPASPRRGGRPPWDRGVHGLQLGHGGYPDCIPDL